MLIGIIHHIIQWFKITIVINNDNRGLASADKETRERVAREGGKASHKKD